MKLKIQPKLRRERGVRPMAKEVVQLGADAAGGWSSSQAVVEAVMIASGEGSWAQRIPRLAGGTDWLMTGAKRATTTAFPGVDASVGGKTGINNLSKNLIGAQRQRAVYCES